MNILALDASTARVSLALVSGGRCLREAGWQENRRGEQPLFDALRTLLRETGMAWRDLDCYVAGRGPGLYSGLRTSITVMQALALPGDQRLYFPDSGVAVAARYFELQTADRVAVVGDARRGMLWYGLFSRQNGVPVLEGGWQLAAWETFDEGIPPSVSRVSSAWSEIAASPAFGRLNRDAWFLENVYPQAAVLAACAERMMNQGEASPPAVPVYMHPPVG